MSTPKIRMETIERAKDFIKASVSGDIDYEDAGSICDSLSDIIAFEEDMMESDIIRTRQSI